jgi:hypothetical protein
VKLPKFIEKMAGQKTKFNWTKSDLVWACCDCGLVHRWRFKLNGEMLTVQGWRLEAMTKQVREKFHRKQS